MDLSAVVLNKLIAIPLFPARFGLELHRFRAIYQPELLHLKAVGYSESVL